MAEEISPLENHGWWMEQLRKDAKANRPEALRLADALDRGGYDAQMARNMEKAAAELRRLHSVNAELLEALRSIVNLWDHHASAHHDGIIYPLHQAARATIAKAEGEAK
jgi:hypothetical protein